MTTHMLLDSVNAGLTKVLKDIAEVHSLNFDELAERYLVKQSQKKQKRPGHVSTYNIFVRETRPSIVSENPELSFAEIAARVSSKWKENKDDGDFIKGMEAKRDAYIKETSAAAAGGVVEPVKAVKASKTKAVKAVPAGDKKVSKKKSQKA